MTLVWVIIAAVALAIELVATHFILLFVALAALITAGGAALSLPVGYQVTLFCVSAVLFPLLLRRPLLRRFSGEGVPSRIDALYGAEAEVTEAIDPVLGTGRVTADGQDWAARSSSSLKAGTRVRVTGADGIVLLVDPLRSQDPTSLTP